MISRIAALTDNPIVRAADVSIVGAAITSPWWRPALHDAAGIATDIAPIAGVLWILIQCACKVWVTARDKKAGE
jgi:hypothetical protein